MDDKMERATYEQHINFSLACHSQYCTCEELNTDCEEMDMEYVGVNVKSFASTGSQCDSDPVIVENIHLRQKVKELNEELQRRKWGVEKIVVNDVLTKFYTGLSTFSIFLWLFNYAASKSSRMTNWIGNTSTPSSNKSRLSTTTLRPVDQFLGFLMRSRLGLFVQDIADREHEGDAADALMQHVYEEYGDRNIVLYHSGLVINPLMPFLAASPDRILYIEGEGYFVVELKSSLKSENLKQCPTELADASNYYLTVDEEDTVILDREHNYYFQVLGQMAVCNLKKAFFGVWSSYGCHIEQIEFDQVVWDECYEKLQGQNHQFTTDEVHYTQEIAELRIHFERNIGRVKNFHVFDDELPVSLIPLATKLFQVCYWLTNLDVPLVEDNDWLFLFASLLSTFTVRSLSGGKTPLGELVA
ncbi:hypothetical protein KUTeg_012179 [Tegillarca granosa]|uniref:Uncharacterized protein n=1 Tax=Tegillarca granosa TaxID=220873 RepID=A0ABQ9EYR5_TEGGR|nr:hypothetical protein KUTeg_012179 [Tegillarca granosa]